MKHKHHLKPPNPQKPVKRSFTQEAKDPLRTPTPWICSGLCFSKSGGRPAGRIVYGGERWGLGVVEISTGLGLWGLGSGLRVWG